MAQQRYGMMTLNYSDIFFGFNFDKDEVCAHFVKDHLLLYVYDGELTLVYGNDTKVVTQGQSVFLRRNRQVSMKDTTSGGRVDALFLVFSRKFLKEYFRAIDGAAFTPEIEVCANRILPLPPSPDITGLFLSMRPYLHSSHLPSKAMIELKRKEAIQAIIDAVPASPAVLFDFRDPWKIDLKDFMEENYLEDITISELASYSGRSLSGFKRDFKEISDLTPERWIIKRRLEDAHRLLQEGKKSRDIYLRLGFKSLSHFSQAYKRMYGMAPSQIACSLDD